MRKPYKTSVSARVVELYLIELFKAADIRGSTVGQSLTSSSAAMEYKSSDFGKRLATSHLRGSPVGYSTFQKFGRTSRCWVLEFFFLETVERVGTVLEACLVNRSLCKTNPFSCAV